MIYRFSQLLFCAFLAMSLGCAPDASQEAGADTAVMANSPAATPTAAATTKEDVAETPVATPQPVSNERPVVTKSVNEGSKPTPKTTKQPVKRQPAATESVDRQTEPTTPAAVSKKGIDTEKQSEDNPKAAAPAPTSEPATPAEPAPTPKPVKPDHSLWNSLLQKHVNSTGKVNYQGFKADVAQLDNYLASLSANPIQADWSRNEKMAYWINAYNAFTVKLIVKNYPVKSIQDLHGGKPWDVKWIELGDKTYSLNQIEHDILRPRYKDPRIHFAVNCAAKSCPPLLNRAWTADQLNNYFEKQTRAFINNEQYNELSPKAVKISKIFDWYQEDFDNIITFLNKYATTEIKSNAKVSYAEYDWALNN